MVNNMTRAAHKFISEHLDDYVVKYHGYTAGGINEEVELTDKQSGERHIVIIEPAGAVRWETEK